LGSIGFGWATPTEAARVGAVGAILLTALNGRLTYATLKDVLECSMLTNAMLLHRSKADCDEFASVPQMIRWPLS